ncbi:MAG: sulfite exporter TauE/SafE family protein [Bacilli bacterium]|nr:sulfite exporter TauE/SafE family protein [Bacilli bacterium]
MGFAEIIFIIVAFLANIVQAITGFAGTVLAMPISIQMVGYDVARPVLNLVSIFICLTVVIIDFKKINYKTLIKLLIFVGIGYALGFLISYFKLIDGKDLLRIYGTIICLIAVALLTLNLNKKKLPFVIQAVVLILAGIMQFLYTSGGPFVVLFMASIMKDKKEFRVTLSAMWIVLNSITFGTNIADGYFTPHVWLLSGIVIASAILSMLIGKMIFKKINTEMFLKFTYILLFISGISAVL